MVLAAAVPTALLGAVESGAEPLPDRQLLFYNHAYGVFDRETADAVEHSTYIREFANFQVRTTTGADGTWTGRYLYGRETYFELFGPGDVADATIGFAGMGVSTERDGDMDTVVQRLRDAGIADPIEFLQTRDFGDGVPVPWFDAIFTSEQFNTFGTWAMEYRPEYLADPRSNVEPPSFPGDVGRERYLNDGYRDRLMRDITAVHIAVTELDLNNSVPLLRAGGFIVKTVPDGVVAVRGGTTIRFEEVPVDQVGVRSVEFSLNRPVSYRHTEQLGSSTLVVGPGSRATWTFDQ